MVLHLRKIVVRSGPFLPKLPIIMEQVQSKVEQACRNRLSVKRYVLLDQVEPSRTDTKNSMPPIQPVHLALRRRVLDPLVDRVPEIHLASNGTLPSGGVRIFEVGHVDVRSRVEGVNHHLSVNRTRYLDAPNGKILRCRIDLPGAVSHTFCFGQKIRKHTFLDSLRDFDSLVEKL